jgi:ABC-2 type transport system permease protein
VIFKAGSIPWLLGHEVRLAFRESRNKTQMIISAVALGILFVILAAAGTGIGLVLRQVDWALTPAIALMVGLMALVTFTFMLSMSLAAAAQALYVRGDLDLLFSSPLPPRTVLTVRFLGIAFNISLLPFFLLAGILIPVAVTGTPQWLGALALVAALGLTAAALGLLLAMALFRVLGPRRTRTVAQVLAALVGAGLFLLFQSGNLVDTDRENGFADTIEGMIRGTVAIQLPPFVDWPARAAVGEPLPLLAIVGFALALFVLVNQALGRRFAKDAASAIGANTVVRRRGGVGDFAQGTFAATLRKELRVLLRDIALLSQVLLRVLFLLPLGFILVRNASEGANYLLPGGAAALSFIAGQVTASLAWITISAEEAPDLLVSSPAPVRDLNRAKLWAALIPTIALLVIPLAALAWFAPIAALAAAAGCAASALSAGMISIWHQRPGRRADFQRKGNLHWLIVLAILVIQALIGFATLLAAWLQPWAIIPAVFAAVFTLALRRTDEQILAALRER